MFRKGVGILQPFNHFIREMYCFWVAPKIPSCSELRATRNFAVFRIFLWFWNFCEALNLHKSSAKVLANRKLDDCLLLPGLSVSVTSDVQLCETKSYFSFS